MSVTGITRAAQSQGTLAALTAFVAPARTAENIGASPAATSRGAEVEAVRHVSAVSPTTPGARRDQVVPQVRDGQGLRTKASALAGRPQGGAIAGDGDRPGDEAGEVREGGALDVLA